MFNIIPIFLTIAFFLALFYGFIRYVLPLILIYMLISYIGKLFRKSESKTPDKNNNKNKDEYSKNIVDVEYEEVD